MHTAFKLGLVSGFILSLALVLAKYPEIRRSKVR